MRLHLGNYGSWLLVWVRVLSEAGVYSGLLGNPVRPDTTLRPSRVLDLWLGLVEACLGMFRFHRFLGRPLTILDLHQDQDGRLGVANMDNISLEGISPRTGVNNLLTSFSNFIMFVDPWYRETLLRYREGYVNDTADDPYGLFEAYNSDVVRLFL